MKKRNFSFGIGIAIFAILFLISNPLTGPHTLQIALTAYAHTMPDGGSGSDQNSEEANPLFEREKKIAAANNFNELRSLLVATDTSGMDEWDINRTPIQLDSTTLLNTEQGVQQAVIFFRNLDASMAFRCGDSEMKDSVELFNNGLYYYLSALNTKATGTEWESLNDFDQNNIKAVLGFMPENMTQKDWGLLWYRSITSISSVGCSDASSGVISGSYLNSSSAILLYYGPKYVRSLGDPAVCMSKMRSETLRQGTTYWKDEPWQMEQYRQSLNLAVNRVEMVYGLRAKYLFMQKYFPFNHGSESDWIQPHLEEVANTSVLTKREKQRFFNLTNSRLKEINRAAQKRAPREYETPFETNYKVSDFVKNIRKE